MSIQQYPHSTFLLHAQLCNRAYNQEQKPD